MAIIELKNDHLEQALTEFENLIKFSNEHDLTGESVSVLKLVTIEDGKIVFKEIKEGDKGFSKIASKDFAQRNITELKSILNRSAVFQ